MVQRPGSDPAEYPPRAAGRPDLLLSAHLRQHLLLPLVLALLHLVRGEVLLARGERPPIPERVEDRAEAIAPEHVARRHDRRGASRDGAVEVGVAVLDEKPKTGGRSPHLL